MLVEPEVVPVETLARSPDRGQGRPEIVADGPQHGGLDRVAAPQSLGLERSERQPLAVERDGQQRGQCGEDALGDRGTRRLSRREEEPADVAVAHLQVGGGFPGLGSADGTELDPRGSDPEHRRSRGGDVLQPVLDVLRLEQDPRDVREERRLALPLLGLRRSPSRTSRELADDDGRDEIDAQREPVLRVAQRERVHRRQEEEVEGEHACN